MPRSRWSKARRAAWGSKYGGRRAWACALTAWRTDEARKELHREVQAGRRREAVRADRSDQAGEGILVREVRRDRRTAPPDGPRPAPRRPADPRHRATAARARQD